MASERTDPIMAFVPSSNPFLKCVDRLQDRIFSRLLVWARKTILLDVATVPISMVSTITLTRAIGINKLPSVFAVIDTAYKSGCPILLPATGVQRLAGLPTEILKVRGFVESARAGSDDHPLSDCRAVSTTAGMDGFAIQLQF